MQVRRLGDPIRRSNAYWAVVVTIIAFVLVGFGIPYLVEGLGATSVPGAFAAIQHLPGGQHTYGAVMTALGVLLAYAMSPALHHRPVYWMLAMAMLGFAVLFSAGAVIAFAISWADTGVLTWGSMIYWATIMMLAFASITLSPDHLEHLGHDDQPPTP